LVNNHNLHHQQGPGWWLDQSITQRFAGSASLAGCLGDLHPGVLLPHEVDVALGQILAHNEAAVVALGVVPAQAVVEEVVENGDTGLVTESVVLEDTVGLRFVLGPAGGPAVKLNRKLSEII
jgi:hypothetical protein